MVVRTPKSTSGKGETIRGTVVNHRPKEAVSDLEDEEDDRLGETKAKLVVYLPQLPGRKPRAELTSIWSALGPL